MDEKFRKHLLERGLSQLSVRVYLRAVSLYFALYRDVGPTELQQFRRHLIAHYKAQTVNLYIIGMNRYLAFLGKERWRLRCIRLQQTYLDNVIGNADYQRLKQLLATDGDLKWYHIVWTLAATGVRVSELVRIRVEDVRTGYLDLCSKADRQRRIYIPRQLRQSLLAWSMQHQRSEGPLFANRHGAAITPRGIAKGLQRAARRAGIDPRLTHPHSFRHLFARNFLQHRNDMALLADLLGHRSLETTKIYLRYTMQEQRDMMDQTVDW